MALMQDETHLLLSQFEKLPELSIVKLSEPILNQDPSKQPEQLDVQAGNLRSSDVSTDNNDNPTPASLQSELNHYKELFTKLRFSYVEQVTKEKFLRFVVGDPPVYVSEHENTILGSHLGAAKQQLKEQKVRVADMIAALEDQSLTLSAQHQDVQRQIGELQLLPGEIDQFKKAIADLAAAQEPLAENPTLGLPLQGTLQALSQREEDLAALDSQIAALEEADADRSLELSRLEDELKPLNAQKKTLVAAAKEARQRKEQGVGGIGDDIEERGRWLQAVQTTMTSLLPVRA